MKYGLCVLYLFFSILGLTFMKCGSMESRKVIFQILQVKVTLFSLMGYFFYMISFLLYTFVITKFDLSYIIPLLGGVINILIFVIGIGVFHEKFTVYSIIGCFCIVIGILFMNMK
mgnify:CR=1 FL=1